MNPLPNFRKLQIILNKTGQNELSVFHTLYAAEKVGEFPDFLAASLDKNYFQTGSIGKMKCMLDSISSG
jgi:hypothetical protein